MAAEHQILELFDSLWFRHAIFSKQPSSPSHAQPIIQDIQTEQLIEETRLHGPRLLRMRSRSDHDLNITTSFLSDSFSPNSVLNTARKLQTIVSGKETCKEEEKEEVIEVEVKKKRVNERRKLRKKGSKSLSELEFEELKGFMDLGFVFTEEDKMDSSLASIVPGLQRLGREKGEHGDVEDALEENVERVSRPYLSEAWDVLERKKAGNPFIKWKIPASNNEIDMKDHLRFWAHTVASTVR